MALADEFPLDAWPRIPCPHCLDGGLAVASILTAEAADSARSASNENWDPTWISGSFHGTLKCSIGDCSGLVAVVGNYRVKEKLNSKGLWFGEFEEVGKLSFSEPALPIMIVPEGTPGAVIDAIKQAATVLWADPPSAANRLRSAVEVLLTAKRVRLCSTNRKGKRVRLHLHGRIEQFKKVNAEAGEALEAVKWIGNSGSHDHTLEVQDVLDGAEILQHALELVYDSRRTRIARSIRAVNKSKGRRRAPARGPTPCA